MGKVIAIKTENSRRCKEGEWRLYWKQQKVPRRGMKAVLKTAEGAKKGNEFRLYWKQQKVPRRGMKAVLKTAKGAKKGNEGSTENSRRCQEGKWRLYWKQQKVPRREMKALLKTAEGAKKENEGSTENSRRCQEGKWRLYWKQQKVPRRKMKVIPCHRWWSKVSETHIWLVIVFVLRWVVSGEVLVGTKIPDWGGKRETVPNATLWAPEWFFMKMVEQWKPF